MQQPSFVVVLVYQQKFGCQLHRSDAGVLTLIWLTLPGMCRLGPTSVLQGNLGALCTLRLCIGTIVFFENHGLM